MGAHRTRNITVERDLTRLAAMGAADPERLIVDAEARARTLSGEYVTDPMHVQTGRDRITDVAEELLDARNHLVWWLEDHPASPDTGRSLRVLQMIVLAYTELRP